MIKIIIIKDLVKKEKEFPKGAVFGSIMLWALMSSVISIFVMFLPLINFIIAYFISAVISIGIAQLSYSIVKGNGQDFSIAFQVCTNTKIFKRAGTLLLGYLFILIGLILFIVPGIILSYAFGLVPFILIDENYQSLSVIETLKKSCELMKKNKMKMFLLFLRYFLVWYVGFFIFSLIIIFSLMTFVNIPMTFVGTPYAVDPMTVNTTTSYAFGLMLLVLLLIPVLIGFSVLMAYISSKYYIALALFYEQIKEEKTDLLEDKTSLQIEGI